MKQEEGEKFEKFVLRLRTQAEKCGFKNKEEHLIDQVTEKCKPVDLRKKILEIGDSITLLSSWNSSKIPINKERLK